MLGVCRRQRAQYGSSVTYHIKHVLRVRKHVLRVRKHVLRVIKNVLRVRKILTTWSSVSTEDAVFKYINHNRQ